MEPGDARETAGPEELSFLASRKYQKLLASTRARAVILGEEARDATALPRIVCKYPYAYYARVAALVNPEATPEPGIHPQAAVHAFLNALTLFGSTRLGSVMLRRNFPVNRSVRVALSPLPPDWDLRSPAMVSMPS